MATCCGCHRPLVVGSVKQWTWKGWLCPVDYPKQLALALVVTAKGKAPQCVSVPLPSQVVFESCEARNILWGGQAGPGKSYGVRQWLYKRSLRIPNHKALLLRENHGQLETTHLFDMRRELPLLGARLVDDVAKFDNGSEIHCGHMADANAVQRYLGTEYGAIVPDEGSLYPVDAFGVSTLAELSTRARLAHRDMHGAMVEPVFLVVTNPGGPSAGWLRDMFIDHQPDFERFPALAKPGAYLPEQWAYLPARLTDNPYMREDYATTTLAILNETRYKQLAEGDWYAFSGQFFAEWAETKDGRPWHVRRLVA